MLELSLTFIVTVLSKEIVAQERNNFSFTNSTKYRTTKHKENRKFRKDRKEEIKRKIKMSDNNFRNTIWLNPMYNRQKGYILLQKINTEAIHK